MTDETNIQPIQSDFEQMGKTTIRWFITLMLSDLNLISNAFLDLAENRANRQLITTMAEWKEQLERFLAMYNYEVLEGAGTVSAEEAKEKAYGEYDKFRLIQDREYLSDFDKEIRNWKELGLFDGDEEK